MIASCGHTVELGHEVDAAHTDTCDCGGTLVIYGTYCQPCVDAMAADGTLLEDDDAIEAALSRAHGHPCVCGWLWRETHT